MHSSLETLRSKKYPQYAQDTTRFGPSDSEANDYTQSLIAMSINYQKLVSHTNRLSFLVIDMKISRYRLTLINYMSIVVGSFITDT